MPAIARAAVLRLVLLPACLALVAGCGGPARVATTGPRTPAVATGSPATTMTPSVAPSAGAPSLPTTDPGTSGTWSAAPPMTHARAAHAVVSTDDAIFALAGTDEGGPVLQVERFDGTAWTDVAELPGDGLNAPAAVVLAGRIYLIGGFGTTTNVPLADVVAYDPATGEWTESAPLPAPRGGHAAVVLEERIHVIGGGNASTTLADHSVYDPATDTWREAAPLPRSAGSVAATVLEGRLYAIGGRSGTTDFGTVDVYDPLTDRWTPGPPIPPRGTAGAVTYCDAIHLFGGESQAEARRLDEVLRLAPDGTWQAAASMPTARAFARVVVLRGGVYVVGGSPTSAGGHATPGSDVVERFEADCASDLGG